MHTELVTDWLTEQSNEKLMKPVTCIVIGKPNRGWQTDVDLQDSLGFIGLCISVSSLDRWIN